MWLFGYVFIICGLVLPRSSEKLQSSLGEIKEVEESEEIVNEEEKEGESGVVVKKEENVAIEKEDKTAVKKEEEVEVEETTAVEVEVHEVEKEAVSETPATTEANHKASEGEGAPQNNTSDKPVTENPSNIERTDSGPPTTEGENDKSPTTSNGDNVASFSSVKHLLS